MKPSVHGTTVPITKAIRQKLRSEIKRTGITAMMLLKDAPDAPDGLTVAHVNRWISGLIDTAPARHVDYVAGKWASLPDAASVTRDSKPLAKRGPRYADGKKRIEVTEEMSKLLRAELARTGIDHAKLLSKAEGTPLGLTARIIRGWLYRDAKSTREDHWSWVVGYLAVCPDFAGSLPPLTRKS